MGFNNGYDSGYADALEDVRSGEVAGLGPAPANEGGTAPEPAPAPSYMTNAANRYVTKGTIRIRYAAPESVTAAMNGAAFDLQVPTGTPTGTVMNVNLTFETSPEPDFWVENVGASIGIDTVTVNGTAVSGMSTLDLNVVSGLLDLVLWYDGASWVCVAVNEAHV